MHSATSVVLTLCHMSFQRPSLSFQSSELTKITTNEGSTLQSRSNQLWTTTFSFITREGWKFTMWGWLKKVHLTVGANLRKGPISTNWH
jgi:hypothetical protein